MEAIKTKRKIFYWPSKFEYVVMGITFVGLIVVDKLFALDLSGKLYQWFGI